MGVQPAGTGGQNPNLNLGAGREDINLGQGSQPQEQAYNSEEQRDVYQSQEESFNDQRHNYTEKAFNSYNYETVMEEVRITAAEFRRAGHTDTGGKLTDPPPIPSENPDSELELSEWAMTRMGVNSVHTGQLKQHREKNSREREKLRKKQPSVRVYSKKEDRAVEIKLSERGYEQKRRDEIRKSDRREQAAARAKRTGRLLFESGMDKEDEDTAAVRHEVHKHASAAKRRIRRNVRDLRDRGYVYRRLKCKDKKDRLIGREGKRLKHEQGRILALNRQMHELERMSEKKAEPGRAEGTGDVAKKEAARRAENRKIQQQKKQRQRIAHQQERAAKESVRRHSRYQHQMNKTTRKEQRIQRKRNRTVISSIASIISIMLVVLLLVVLFMMTFFGLFADLTTKTVTQNDYTVLTDVTGYLRNLEAELKDLMEGEGREKLEEDLDGEYFLQTGKHVYEFIYDLPEFGFDDITLMAYLSAKFFEFDLEMVQDDLDGIFELMYQTDIRFREEERTFYDETGNPYTQEVIICYITVDKTELEEIVETGLDDEALELYHSYKLSCGGQQAYGPALDGIDWSSKISSPFGYRIHPITGNKKFHDGVDIAIPTGTRLYSAVTGTVTSAHYSNSAGNMVTVRTESGWEVTYMHMDSLSVREGQPVFKPK